MVKISTSCLLRNPNILYHIHKICSLNSIQLQMNPFHIRTAQLFLCILQVINSSVQGAIYTLVYFYNIRLNFPSARDIVFIFTRCFDIWTNSNFYTKELFLIRSTFSQSQIQKHSRFWRVQIEYKMNQKFRRQPHTSTTMNMVWMHTRKKTFGLNEAATLTGEKLRNYEICSSQSLSIEKKSLYLYHFTCRILFC
jgi:hypothetical protein